MPLSLMVDIGNQRLKGGYFKEDHLISSFSVDLKSPSLLHEFKSTLSNQEISFSLISSVNPAVNHEITSCLQEKEILYSFFNRNDLKLHLDVEEKDEVGMDRLANIYGALSRFPANDCLIIDIGTAVTFDIVEKSGRYLGGAIYPGTFISAQALAQNTAQLPLVSIEKPLSPIGKTTKTHIQSGLYWGLLGAIERITAELKLCMNSPSSVEIIATGGITQFGNQELLSEKIPFAKDLKELVDFIEPNLTLIGIYEIFKELKNKKGEHVWHQHPKN